MIRKLSALLAIISVGACQHHAQPRPAVLSDGSEQTLTQLRSELATAITSMRSSPRSRRRGAPSGASRAYPASTASGSGDAGGSAVPDPSRWRTMNSAPVWVARVPMKVAVMGCVVNGPGEAEGADVAVFAGDRKGIIYVQGERVATVPEDDILDRLLDECKTFQSRVESGEVKLGQKRVDIVPPDPLGELGSGWEKMAAERIHGGTDLTIGKT